MHRSLIWIPLLLLSGCRSFESDQSGSEPWSPVERHMTIADTLEQANLLAEASLEYTLAAQLYPSSEYYPMAVRKAAFLYSDKRNPARNDSVSIFWFNRYLELPLSAEQREITVLYLQLREEASTLRNSLTRQRGVSDSLQTIIKRQGNEIGNRAKRLGELEAELAKANDELQKLREIDVKMHKTKK